MKTLEKIQEHYFIKELQKDIVQYFSGKSFNVGDIELKETDFDELEYFIHRVGFYTMYFLVLCRQLEYGIKFLSNFNYEIKSDYNRIDHLRYNIENYIIRFHSLSDRLLQVINSVFHLTIDECEVDASIIMTNLRVARTNVPSKYRSFKSIINKLNPYRNIILHRHSYLEKELKKLELFYQIGNPDTKIKSYRSQQLKNYVKKKTDEFRKNNEDVFLTIPNIFNALLIEYRKQRKKLELITGR
jgi:hypothetical protein